MIEIHISATLYSYSNVPTVTDKFCDTQFLWSCGLLFGNDITNSVVSQANFHPHITLLKLF